MDNQDLVMTQENLEPETTQEANEEGKAEEKETQPTDINWVNLLEDDYKNHPSIKKFKDLNGLAKSYLELSSFIGKKKIPLPGKDAKPEEWEFVWNALGRPESPDKYELPELKLPEDHPGIDENLLKEFKQTAHKIGLNNNQVKSLLEWWADLETRGLTDLSNLYQEEMEEAETKLRQEWGSAYETKLNLAKKVLQQFGDDEVKQLLDSGAGNDPAIIKMFAKIGEAMSEGNLIKGKSTFTLTPEEAEAEIRKILGDKNHPYFDKSHPEHELAIKRMFELHQMVMGGK